MFSTQLSNDNIIFMIAHFDLRNPMNEQKFQQLSEFNIDVTDKIR